jgi:hypothetical protein
MSKPNSDDSNTNSDDAKEVSGVAPTLDQVHQMNQAKVEAEDLENEEDNADDSSDSDAGVGDSGSASNDSNDEDGEDEDGSGEDEQSGDEVVQPPVPPVVEESKVESAAQLDTDITKPGAGKVAVKDADGTTFYFNNSDEIPEDFEPASYKALTKATIELYKKETTDEANASTAEADRLEAERTAENQRQADAMQAAWEVDTKALVDQGLFPKDAKKLVEAQDEVYNYIDSEMKKGNIITSFMQAYKGLQFDKEQVAKAEQQKKIDQAKKNRGGIVQSGSGGSSGDTGSSTRGRVITAPPSGVSLDAVHNRAIEQLNN